MEIRDIFLTLCDLLIIDLCRDRLDARSRVPVTLHFTKRTLFFATFKHKKATIGKPCI